MADWRQTNSAFSLPQPRDGRNAKAACGNALHHMLESSLPTAWWFPSSPPKCPGASSQVCVVREGQPQLPQLLPSSEKVEGASGRASAQTPGPEGEAGHILTLIPGKVTADEA